MIGELLADRYLLQELLGSGGMCDVYLATDRRLPQRWAVKKLSGQGRQTASGSLQAEARILSPLNHPYLPRTVDFLSHQGSEYLVMDYCPGETLAEVLKAGRLSLEEALLLADKLCDVLGYLHSRRPPVIFRDLKPENIILTEDGGLKLIDFGIARLLRQTANKDTQALGTPGYAAPEQYGRGQSDARTDIYGLGATLHHALSGQHPSESPFTFPPLCSLCAELPLAVERVVDKAVSLRPEDRYQEISELREALHQLRAPRERPTPPVASSSLRLLELEQQVVALESALSQAEKGLLDEQARSRKSAAAAQAGQRALEEMLAGQQEVLRALEERLAGVSGERAALEQTLSTAQARVRALEVEALRQEETTQKAQDFWQAELVRREHALQDLRERFRQGEAAYTELLKRYQQAATLLSRIEAGESPLAIASARLAELELELSALRQDQRKWEKQKSAMLAQLNLLRDEAMALRHNDRPIDPEPTSSARDLLRLEAALERSCRLWLRAEEGRVSQGRLARRA